MSVSTEDFLEQANRLLAGGNEIDRRSAISRSYYAVYHCALSAAERLNLPDAVRRDAGVHEKLIGRFETQSKGLKKLARRLRDSKRARGVADYDLDELVPVNEAALVVRGSQLLAADIDRLGRKSLEEIE
ncbi:TPA: hypothetical protein QEM72_004423 [Pseudomonas putida]|uniref:hypothetical protein n=1 Tax=Pseudomonas putida TaxID=303 RepID=UPI002363A60F|nr:hypothetical protein [Pseudomonas putida]MDD2077065.1 hypothetical protein [Pseudomonas putida]HDS1693839.1 hypothetical protein [Pseudomonas putida]